MKKEYLRPEAELVSFLLNEAVTATDTEDEFEYVQGSAGDEVW
jgi:hypothetical protein